MQAERFVGFVLVWIGLACTFVDTVRNSSGRMQRSVDGGS
jgi:hypothetical protein